MDSFDDLLAPSRHALEDNPFADPFAKQPGSPDPWATPFDPHAYDNTSQHFESPINSPGPVHAADDDDNKPLGRNQSPGFRESIGTNFSETATNFSETATNFSETATNFSETATIRPETLEWQTEAQTPWQSEHEHPLPIPSKQTQADEDSDDDKPVMQTLKHHDQDDSVSVTVSVLHTHTTSVSPIHCSIVVFLRRHLRKQFEKMIKESNLYS